VLAPILLRQFRKTPATATQETTALLRVQVPPTYPARRLA
jgi:hypothetical protein